VYLPNKSPKRPCCRRLLHSVFFPTTCSQPTACRLLQHQYSCPVLLNGQYSRSFKANLRHCKFVVDLLMREHKYMLRKQWRKHIKANEVIFRNTFCNQLMLNDVQGTLVSSLIYCKGVFLFACKLVQPVLNV